MINLENYFTWDESCKETYRSNGQKWEVEDWHTSPMMDIGIWYLIGGSDDKNPMNGMCKQINPLYASKYRGLPLNRSDFVAANWFEFFQYHVKFSIDWLQPTRLTNMGSPQQGDPNPHPLLYFLAPHGRIGDYRHYFDHYTVIRCKERGLDHLVDGYYENIRQLRSMGINCITHVGSPDNHNDFNRIKDEYKRVQLDLLILSRQAAAFDAGIFFKADSATFKFAEELWANKIPVGLEGTFRPKEDQHWLKAKNPYTNNMLGENILARCHPKYKDPVIGAGFPLAGTKEFEDAYAGHRFYIKLEFGAFKSLDGTHGHPDGNEASQRQYFAYFASQTKELKQLIPNSKILLPHGFDIRCATLKIAPSYFLPNTR